MPSVDRAPEYSPILPMPSLPLSAPAHPLAHQALRTLPYISNASGVVLKLRPYNTRSNYPCGRWDFTEFRHLNISLMYSGGEEVYVWPKNAFRVYLYLEEPNQLIGRLMHVKAGPDMWQYLKSVDSMDNGGAYHGFTIDPATTSWYNSAPGPSLRTMVPYFLHEHLIPPVLPKVYDTACIGSHCKKLTSLPLKVAVACTQWCDTPPTHVAVTAKDGVLLFAHAKVAVVWNDMFMDHGLVKQALESVPFLASHPMMRFRPQASTTGGNQLPGAQMKSRVIQAFFGRCVVLLKWAPPAFQILEQLGFKEGVHFMYWYNHTDVAILLQRVAAHYPRYVAMAEAGFAHAMATLTQRAFVRDFLLPMFVPKEKRFL